MLKKVMFSVLMATGLYICPSQPSTPTTPITQKDKFLMESGLAYVVTTPTSVGSAFPKDCPSVKSERKAADDKRAQMHKEAKTNPVVAMELVLEQLRRRRNN